MSKKNFTAPFWVMLTLGLIACCQSFYTLYRLTQVLVIGDEFSLRFRMKYFYLPVIMLIEALMYLLVRRKEINRRTAWTHIFLFAFALSTIFIKEGLLGFYFNHLVDLRSYEWVVLGQIFLFWGATIVAHIFFARVLINAFSKKAVIVQETNPSQNLLDDVLD